MTGSEGMVGSLQQREARDTASTALLFTDHQSVGMETPAGVQVEVEHWEEGGSEDTAERKGNGQRGQRKGREEDVGARRKQKGAFKYDI